MAIAQEPGVARSPGLSYQQLLDTDTHEVPKVLREESPRFLGDEDVSIERYISRDWFEREKERLWARVWQFACREEHMPERRRLHPLRDRRAVVPRRPGRRGRRSRPTPTPACTAAAS